jgi:hypothetical protein
MLRNLLAIIVATIAGLAIAKFVEGAIGGGAAPGETIAGAEQAGLVIGWGVGAFVAAALALAIGRRWAPLGWLGAGTIFFAAAITLMTFSLPLLLWPTSAAATGAGGWLAIKLLKAQYAYPNASPKATLFD